MDPVSEALLSPVTICVMGLLVLVWTWNHFRRRVNPMHVFFNYDSMVQRKQYWRVVSSACSHESLYHLIVNLIMLMSYRFVEVQNGSLFYLGYSLLFMAANRSIALLVGYLDFSNRIRSHFMSSIGYSDVLISWSGYYAFYHYNAHVYILGLVPVSAYIMALVLLNLSLIFTSVVNRPLVCYIALITGALVGLGFNLLPTSYWEVAFIIDTFLILAWSAVSHPPSHQVAGDDVDTNTDEALEHALWLSRHIQNSGVGVNGTADGSQNSISTSGENRNINSGASIMGDVNNV